MLIMVYTAGTSSRALRNKFQRPERNTILFRGDASFNPHLAANATSAAIETLVFSIVFMTLVSFVYLSH
jgi:hypothetical protein